MSTVQQATAQGRGQNKNKVIRKLQKVVWTGGIHGVVVDDDGRPFRDLFKVQQSWNILPFPTRLNLEGFIKNGWSAELVFAYSRYNAGKMLNNDITTSAGTFLAMDVNARYYRHKLIANTKAFDPYLVGGLGYTFRSALQRGNLCPTANIGLGFSIWFNRGLGLNLQSIAKFKLLPQSSNYLMHSVGLLFRFDLRTGYRGRVNRRYHLF
jgi:OOP family OmpA-OmpF porin